MQAATVELVAADASATELLGPFDEQTGFDVAAGRRELFALQEVTTGAVAGSAVAGEGSLDLQVQPAHRGRGLGGSAAVLLLDRAGDGELNAWSHEDHPAARALATRFGFTATRTLLQLRLDGLGRLDTPAAPAARRAGAGDAEGADAGPEAAGGARRAIDAFRPEIDDAEWLALNARVFAFHPEQGGVTQSDLDERIRAPWFRADDFLIARDDAGRMVGYNWLKVEPGTTQGEIYVIGVAPEASAHGIGRALMVSGLARLRERGCDTAELYVEGDNARAVHLYRTLGFVDAAVHVQYSRSFTPR